MSPDHAGQRTLVGNSQCRIPQLKGSLYQFSRLGGAFEETEIAETVEFGIRHIGTVYLYSTNMQTRQCTPVRLKLIPEDHFYQSPLMEQDYLGMLAAALVIRP